MEKLTDDALCDAIANDYYIEAKDLKQMKKQSNLEEIYVKLNKYEKTDKELGCPFEKLIKFSKQETVYTKYGTFTNEIVLVDLNLGRIHITKNQDLNNTYLLYISDYKVTWWLKADKSE